MMLKYRCRQDAYGIQKWQLRFGSASSRLSNKRSGSSPLDFRENIEGLHRRWLRSALSQKNFNTNDSFVLSTDLVFSGILCAAGILSYLTLLVA